MTDIFLFAGTIEGKELAEALGGSGLSVHAFTATEYGGTLLSEGLDRQAPAGGCVCISSERLDETQMGALMREESPRLVIDATHPYAVEVSENIRRAAQAAGIRVIRVQRPASADVEAKDTDAPVKNGASADPQAHTGAQTAGDQVVHVASAGEAAEFLAMVNGNVLLTCGSKELPAFAALDGYQERLYARVLSTEQVVRECTALGFSGKHLIAMQGPFSLEMNRALIRHTKAEWLVTKESGVQGGFPEKAEAAALEGIGLVIIDRPADASGDVRTSHKADAESAVMRESAACQEMADYIICDSVDACLKEVYLFFRITPDRRFTLLGIGPGSFGGLTMDGLCALEEADVVIGATRMLEILERIPGSVKKGTDGRKPRNATDGGWNHRKKPTFRSWKPDEMQRFLEENPQYQNVVVALSGDPGFYSGAAKLLELWRDEEVCVLPGLSTLQTLCAKAKADWQHVYCISRHGRTGNLLAALRTQTAVFLLPGETLPELCGKLTEGGFARVQMAVGSRLSYEDEQVLCGTPAELQGFSVKEPYAVLISNPSAKNAVVTPGVPDAAFLRIRKEKTIADAPDLDARIHSKQAVRPRRTVPMTKEEVRTVSLAKLRLTKHAVVYDIGAGTGSVSVEAARIADAGCVYAIEQNPAAVELLHENRARFGLDNMEIIAGMAPETMADLPAPTHAFIGGSKGNLGAIVEALLEKNPAVRIVINTVTVETEAEARQVLNSLEARMGNDGEERAVSGQSNGPAEWESANPEIIHLSVTREERVGRYHMQRAENPIAIISFGGARTGMDETGYGEKHGK